MWPTVFNIPWLNLPIRGYGLMLMIGFLGGTWWAARRAYRVKCDPDFVINMGFIALLSSIVGARLFYVLHYWDSHFAGRGLWAAVDITAGGMEFYGGFLGAVLALLIYMLMKRAPMRLYLDIIAPSLMFGMGVTRVGCFLNGCCWGAACPAEIPWSVSFPYASPASYRQWEDREATFPAELIDLRDNFKNSDLELEPTLIPRDFIGLTADQRARAVNRGLKSKEIWPACRQADARREFQNVRAVDLRAQHYDIGADQINHLAAAHRTHAVQPVQLYAALDGLLMAIMLNALFYRRKQHGLVAGMVFLLYPFVRVLEEIIRSDNPHDVVGMTISQFISVAIFVVGVIYLIVIYRLPANSIRQAQAAPARAPQSPNRERASHRK